LVTQNSSFQSDLVSFREILRSPATWHLSVKF
jgi:hypothetical protein